MTTESSPAAADPLEETMNSATVESEPVKEKAKPESRKGGLIFLIDIKSNTVRSYRKAAMAGGAQADDIDNQVMVGSLADMDRVPTATLVALYNLVRPEKPIKKFADRATANKRMYPDALEILAGKPIEGGSTTVATKAKKTAAKKVAAPKKERTEGAGRESVYAGKVITKMVDENPRREGTAGFKSFALIKNGMTYEKYIAAGGRRKDLAWDEAHKYVKVSKA